MLNKIFSLFFIVASASLSAQLTQDKQFVPHLDESFEEMQINVSMDELSDLIDLQQKSLGKNAMYPTGKLLPLQLDLIHEFDWTETQSGNNVGKLQINAPGATGLELFFNDFYLPLGCKLSIYSPDGKQIIGPYQFADNRKEGKFTSGLIQGEKIVVELFLPSTAQSVPILKTEFLAFERDPKKLKASRDFGDSGDCQVNVECSEGDNWQNEKNSVVRIRMAFGGFLGWCSGTIMNNTYQDCSPYILTADHCRQLEDGTVAEESEYANWDFYFNYESDRCRNPNNEGDVTVSKLTGCTRKASTSNGGDGDSDFLLLRLDNDIPSFYNPFFAGWDKRGIPASSGVMIHHPAGDIKKISTITRQFEMSEWDANLARNTHWKVYWTSTSNGFGVSEGGSSGSAVFDQNHRVVGQLTGGSSACESGGGQGPFNPDYFGLISRSWAFDMTDSSTYLGYWLDNGGSNARFVDGIQWPCNELPLSKEELSDETQSLKVFPNPAHDKLTIEFNGEGVIHIFDIHGRDVFKSEVNDGPIIELSTETMESGVYLIQWTEGELIRTQKLLIE